MPSQESVCIVDFSGMLSGSEPVSWTRSGSFWCDWFPDEQVVKFGGQWGNVPDMKAVSRPTDDECTEYAETYLRNNPDVECGAYRRLLNEIEAK